MLDYRRAYFTHARIEPLGEGEVADVDDGAHLLAQQILEEASLKHFVEHQPIAEVGHRPVDRDRCFLVDLEVDSVDLQLVALQFAAARVQLRELVLGI